MTRPTGGAGWRYESSVDLTTALILGPTDGDGLTDEMLEVGWQVERDGLMRSTKPPGDRPWGWWAFELGEEMPATEQKQIIRLMELGELAAEEIEAARRRAQQSIYGAGASDRAEAGGAVTTGPRGAAERMRARREMDAARWRSVLEALGFEAAQRKTPTN